MINTLMLNKIWNFCESLLEFFNCGPNINTFLAIMSTWQTLIAFKYVLKWLSVTFGEKELYFAIDKGKQP